MTEPLWIEEHEVLVIHDQLLVAHGGAAGVRDDTLLKSALARPRQIYAYGENTEIIDLASACTVGIIRNHPFVDGNKRTGFVVGILFLELNGFVFGASEEAAADAVMKLAGTIWNESDYTRFLKANSRRLSA